MISLLEGMATTRAIRRYTDDPIPEEDLATILWHATRAPSGSNRQPFRFVVLRDGPIAVEAKALLGRSFREMWQVKVAHDRYDEGSGADESSPKARMARTMQHFVDHFEETPVVVLPCLVRYRDPTPTEGASIYPACQNLLLAARALGYGGVMTTWHQLVEDELRPLLGIPDGVVIAATIPLGKPAGQPRPRPPPPARRARLRGPLGRARPLGRRSRGHPLHQRRPTPLTTSVQVRTACGR